MIDYATDLKGFNLQKRHAFVFSESVAQVKPQGMTANSCEA